MIDNINWLVIGGSGYIGSHISRYFLEKKENIYILDNLSTGLKKRNVSKINFYSFDCRETKKLNDLLNKKNIRGVIHLASLKQARESLREPLKYWDSNINATISILKSFENSPVKFLLFSGSCSIYGSSNEVIEDIRPNPLSPYAWTKLCSEQIIKDCSRYLDLSWMSLRYFNVIGNGDFPFAHDTSKECLVPSIFSKLSLGELPKIFGTKFPTKDGSAVRDYIDVRDLAEIHFLAANFLISNKEKLSLELNVGTGEPITVLEIFSKICSVLDIKEDFEDLGSKPTDPPAIWANTNKFKKLFNWKPKYTLEDSINSYIKNTSYKKDEKIYKKRL